MSYKNFSDTIALVAIYNTSSNTTSNTSVDMPIDTSLHVGNLSSDEFSFTQNASLMGDFYGYSNTSGSVAVSGFFVVDNVEQTMSQDRNYDGNTNSSRGPEPFYANVPKSIVSSARYKRKTNSANTTTEAGYPRITGVLIQ